MKRQCEAELSAANVELDIFLPKALSHSDSTHRNISPWTNPPKLVSFAISQTQKCSRTRRGHVSPDPLSSAASIPSKSLYEVHDLLHHDIVVHAHLPIDAAGRASQTLSRTVLSITGDGLRSLQSTPQISVK